VGTRVAMVVSTVGYHWEEVFGAYDEFRKARCEVAFYTVDGRPPKPDPLSLKVTGPLSWVGFGISAAIAPDSPAGRELSDRLCSVRPLAELDPDAVDALYLPGGHGCLFDMNRNPALHAVIAQMYRAGKPLSGVCHATSTFAFVAEGEESIVKGRKLTGFPNPLDEALSWSGGVAKAFLPLPFSNDRALQDGGADLTWVNQLMAALNPGYVRIDPPFVSGMGPKAARPVARAVLRELSKRPEHLPPVGGVEGRSYQ
jgi:putative intracellular protease/amidase